MTNAPYLSYRQLSPVTSKRKSWHDYTAPCTYLIVIPRNPETGSFSEIDRDKNKYILTESGEAVNKGVTEWLRIFPDVRLMEFKILPDALFLLLNISYSYSESLASLIGSLKEECSRKYLNSKDYSGLSTLEEPEDSYYESIFAGGFDDRIIGEGEELERTMSYLSRCEEESGKWRNNPDFKQRFYLNSSDGRGFEGLGNLFLLNDPMIDAVKVSSRYTPDELTSNKRRWLKTILNGGVIVSPFVSGAERTIRDWALANGGRVIQLLANGFGESYYIEPLFRKPLSEGRLLILASAEYDVELRKPSREQCVKMNETASFIAQHSILMNPVTDS